MRESFLHSEIRFLNVHCGYYTATVYIHHIFFPSFQFNSRKPALCSLMLKAANFSYLWVSWVYFACWFLVFLNCCYVFFFFYCCIAATTRTTITITNNNSVSEGKGTPETNFKVWSSKFRSFGGKKEWISPKLILLPGLGLGSTYTHTHTHTHTHKVWL